MNPATGESPLPLSALNDFLFCPRRAGLKFIEGLRGENEHTVIGDLAHEHVDFQHTSALGNAPAHKVLDLVKVTGRKDAAGKFPSGSEFPGGLHDYTGSAPDGPLYTLTNNHGVVSGCSETKPAAKDGNNPLPTITARRLIWEIPAVT